MLRSLSKWKPKHLLLSWVAYWVALTAVTLGPAIAAAWRISRVPTGASISASINNTVLNLSMTANDATVWAASASLPVISLWIVGPPLLIWIAWLMRRPRGNTDVARGLASSAAPLEIAGGMPPDAGVRASGGEERVGERRR
jgi:hypothetical protein